MLSGLGWALDSAYWQEFLRGHAKADKLGSSSTAGQGAGRRLQGARVEKWDSDSDSDKSDDEAGLMV